MNVVVVLVVLAVLVGLVTSGLRSRQVGRYPSRVRPLARRFLHRRKRQIATRHARELRRAIIEDRPDPTAHLAAGVILQPGELPWARCQARLAVRTSQAASTTHSQMTRLGHQARNVTRPITTESWKDSREITWLITSQRIVGRISASGEMISVWWSGLAGLDIDLKRERIVLNATNGWTGILSGPTVAPIAVAAIATCHGPNAMHLHPALHEIQPVDPHPTLQTKRAETITSGGTIVRLPTRTQ